jgi:Fur family ferric uptake transcriptional regulator
MDATMTFLGAGMKRRPDNARLRMALETAGLRVSPQRVAMLSVLADADDHPDALELYRRVKAFDGAISLPTVYRNLTVLETAGLVERNCFEGGRARFETTAVSHHDHIVDFETNDVIEFRSDEIKRLQRKAAAALGYEVIHHRLELYCRKIPGK